MDYVTQFFDIVLHLNHHLNSLAIMFGPWTYVILFAIIFAETGLIVFPFLPGDSLLFALGAMTTVDNAMLDWSTLAVLLSFAAVLGDLTNYTIGSKVGPRIFNSEKTWLFNRKHLISAQEFYEKHGGKTVVLARFMPIFRTFVPFVTGISKMPFRRYLSFNVGGGVSWVVIFLVLGRFFGNIPAVKENFHFVVIGIVVISVLPAVFQFVKSHRQPV